MPVKRKQAALAVSDAPAKELAAIDDASDEESSAASEEEMSAEKRAELLKGFDSDSESDEEGAAAEDDRIIELSNLTPTISSALSKKKKVDESGVLYVGRIPHGFYEEEMTSYFTQFGTILNLRMSRSKKTGRSRHYAFIEFADRGVAEIVAQTMHNYLLAAHLLQVILLTPEEFQKKGGKELFKGAGKKFKAVPWAQIAKDRVEQPKTAAQWKKVEAREEARRVKQSQKIKDAGIDYSYDNTATTKKVKTAPASGKSEPTVAATRKSSGTRKVSARTKIAAK